MLSFDKIVNKMLKNWWKVFLKDDIFEIVDPERKPEYKNQVDKIIYRLKAEWVIISLKAGVYIVPNEDDLKLNSIDLLERYYFKMLKKYIVFYAGSDYFISGRKSLEFHMKNFEVPEKIFVVTRNINKKLTIWNLEIIFKTISWKIHGTKVNLYSKLSEFVIIKNIENSDFKISCLELSLIESALVNDTELWVPVELLSKTIKKYSSIFDRELFYKIWKFKFSMSFNRLKEIAKPIDRELYEVFLDIIKKNGWLFIWEWLRWF